MRIRVFPDPVLREKAKEIRTSQARDTADALISSMRSSKGCVGVAAPQLGMLSRVAVVDVTGHKKASESHGLLVLVNPVILHSEGAITGREGCLSVPDFTGNVTRAEKIKVGFSGIDGADIVLETSGFEAVAIQHELDHLDGVLFIDRIRDMKRDLFRRKNY